ncbi:MAG: hypothetical protein J2P31_01985 [Blastocatellia bacterium]|nr:hypothetical protein [Blastocatellia bacterium]
MSLKTRQNPDNGILEVFVNGEWVKFEDYRKQQIEEAYQNSIKFLRDRLGEDAARELTQKSNEADNESHESSKH